MMKKIKTLVASGLAVAILSSIGLAACGKTVDEYALSAYKGENKDANGNTVYNTELFYSNTVQQGYPDPQVLDDTAKSGYYYLFGSAANFTAMRSKNLAEWENVGPTFPRGQQGTDVEKATWTNLWAPECVYDHEADDGEFDYTALLDGYTKDMEFDCDENAGVIQSRWEVILSDISKVKPPYSLFIGDSFFELFGNGEVAGNNTFDKYFAEHCVNAGVCGSKFSDWLDWADNLNGVPSPEKVAINLGFNDLHTGESIAKVCADFEKLTEILKGFFPQAKIYLIGVVHAPNCANYLEKENKYNAKIQKSAKKNGVNFVEWNSLIENSGQNCFHTDAIHPGDYGYCLFARFLKDLLKG